MGWENGTPAAANVYPPKPKREAASRHNWSLFDKALKHPFF